MIRGRFDRGRPYVQCRVVIPRLQVDRRVMLLLDTGASVSCLHPSDAIRAGISFAQLGDRTVSHGIGGSSPYFREAASLLFDDDRQTRIYHLNLLIAEPNESNGTLPSLLGRDVINRWLLEYDPMNDSLECTARSADFTIDPV
jgi:hypothetical protein